MPFYYFKARVEEEIRNVLNDAYLLHKGVANPYFINQIDLVKFGKKGLNNAKLLKKVHLRFIKTP